MALFGGKKEVTKEKNSGSIGSATIITNGSKIEGNIVGNDTVHVDGELVGNIAVNNVVVVGKSGVVKGNIKAKQIICNGSIEGSLECRALEIMQQANLSNRVLSDTVIIDGNFDGEIVAQKILVDTRGVVKSKLQAKEIVIKGVFEGDLSCELLTTKVTGKIKGNMFVKNILNEGGLVEGSIGQYKDLFVKEIENKEENIEDVEIEEKK